MPKALGANLGAEWAGIDGRTVGETTGRNWESGHHIGPNRCARRLAETGDRRTYGTRAGATDRAIGPIRAGRNRGEPIRWQKLGIAPPIWAPETGNRQKLGMAETGACQDMGMAECQDMGMAETGTRESAEP